MAEVLTKPLAIIHQQSWLTGEVPGEWKVANVVPIHKLDLGPGEVREQILFRAITQNMQNKQGIRASPHSFLKSRCCLTSLISFSDWVTHPVDEEQTVGVGYLDFSKIVSYRILWEKVAGVA
ncbi:hypothetical protein DUI87_22311 [Hirundo rustica rustica]|uniref:Uncharacterized protein n=1 Tax=Hirundo rustica rustica TaxID=333673 RepID=A0A3M0K1N5_HIRRU|nr:hypothetical protein DUI87_22311 [Hirundo rustica rustica]